MGIVWIGHILRLTLDLLTKVIDRKEDGRKEIKDNIS